MDEEGDLVAAGEVAGVLRSGVNITVDTACSLTGTAREAEYGEMALP